MFAYQSFVLLVISILYCSSCFAVVYCRSSIKMCELCQESVQKYFQQRTSATCLSLPAAPGSRCATR